MPLPKASIVILLIAPIFGGDDTPRIARDLTVHEWGTFTSVAGDDGNAVDWHALGCKSDLPTFVNDFGFRNAKSVLQGTVRMETPVMYFYSPLELDVHVKVAFPKGVITESYPRAEREVYQKDAKDGSMRRLPANLNGFDTTLRSVTGAIEWKDVKVQPDSMAALPIDSEPSRYYAARETDAAPIAVGDQHEKFLFYRGVGRFPVPLSARVSGDGKIVVENRGHDPVPSVILFENLGGRLGYRNAGAVRDTVTIAPLSLYGSLAQLQADLEGTLIRQGLFPREARAMLDTWRDSWFEEGSRLIYILPSRSVDADLPLQIAPSPLAVTRVFVGRIELISPEVKRSVEQAIAKSDAATLERYSRFLHPILAAIYPRSQLDGLEQSLWNMQHRDGCR